MKAQKGVMILVAIILFAVTSNYLLSIVRNRISSPAVSICRSDEIPVVQIFMMSAQDIYDGKTCPDYIESALSQSSKFNKCVVFIGEQVCEEQINRARLTSRRDHQIAFESARSYSSAILPLRQRFPHSWFPRNRVYEFFCFARFLVLQEFMKRHSKPMAFFQDSDTLLFTNINELVSDLVSGIGTSKEVVSSGISEVGHWKPIDIAVVTDSTSFSSGHFSLFSAEGLADFNEFVLNDLFFNRTLSDTNGFSDMIAFNLYQFLNVPMKDRWCEEFSPHPFRCGNVDSLIHPPLQHKRKFEVLSLERPLRKQSGIIGKFNLNIEGAALVEWRNNVPYLSNTDIRYFGIHFQGSKKQYLNYYSSPKVCTGRCTCSTMSCDNCKNCTNWS